MKSLNLSSKVNIENNVYFNNTNVAFEAGKV